MVVCMTEDSVRYVVIGPPGLSGVLAGTDYTIAIEVSAQLATPLKDLTSAPRLVKIANELANKGLTKLADLVRLTMHEAWQHLAKYRFGGELFRIICEYMIGYDIVFCDENLKALYYTDAYRLQEWYETHGFNSHQWGPLVRACVVPDILMRLTDADIKNIWGIGKVTAPTVIALRDRLSVEAAQTAGE